MIEINAVVADGLSTDLAPSEMQREIAAVLDAAGIVHDQDTVSLDVRLVDRKESADLNQRYRAKAYATNVLSFPADLVLPGFRALGDLVICMPAVMDEAAAQGKSPAAHFTHLMIHGTFHLLGYDHIADDEAEIMENAERQVMATLGFDDPYRAMAAD